MQNSTINPAPPGLPGLAWRAITRADLAALVKLADECVLVDGGLAFLNEPDTLLGRYFADAPDTGIGAFAAGGQLVACSTLHLAGAGDAQRVIIVGQVQPGLRNKGIGTYLVRWSQAQVRSLVPAGAVSLSVLRIATESLTESANRLYRAHGFESVFEELVIRRSLQLPLPEYPMSPEIGFTSWQPALADQFFEVYQAAFRDRPGFPGFSAAEWISDINENQNFRPDWSLLARVAGQPVGFLTASAERPGGYVVQVGVIPVQRRRGLASALMLESMRRMQKAGLSSTDLVVNVNNPPAIQTYIALGFVTIGRRARYERAAEG